MGKPWETSWEFYGFSIARFTRVNHRDGSMMATMMGHGGFSNDGAISFKAIMAINYDGNYDGISDA